MDHVRLLLSVYIACFLRAQTVGHVIERGMRHTSTALYFYRAF
jgi:hypothetical protein